MEYCGAMKRHVALTLLALTTLGILNAHVDLPQVDGRRFVLAQGRLHDPLGWLEDRWNTLRRSCGAVRTIAPSDPTHARVRQAIQAFSPPDSHSAQLVQLLALGPWLLAEVEFAQLSPAVVVLHGAPAPVVMDGAIWSGSTEPWRPAPLIRQHLRARAPGMPADLAACYTPQQALFKPR